MPHGHTDLRHRKVLWLRAATSLAEGRQSLPPIPALAGLAGDAEKGSIRLDPPLPSARDHGRERQQPPPPDRAGSWRRPLPIASADGIPRRRVRRRLRLEFKRELSLN